MALSYIKIISSNRCNFLSNSPKTNKHYINLFIGNAIKNLDPTQWPYHTLK